VLFRYGQFYCKRHARSSGSATLRKTPLKHQWLLASVPVLFAAQHFTKGLLWLSLKRQITIGPYSQQFAIHAFYQRIEKASSY
jgi:hypothetical protein